MKTDNPFVHEFMSQGLDGENLVRMYLRPGDSSISVTVWRRDKDGKVIDIGKTQTVHMSRSALIGMAYEILQAAKE